MDAGNASLFSRGAGILLHPTCLPGPHGSGDLGPGARRWLDFLEAAGASIWQVLPLVPPGGGFSPYATPSAFAGNPWLLDLGDLRHRGLLDATDLESPAFPLDRVDPAALEAWKGPRLRKAAARLAAGGDRERLEAWRESRPWVEDAALFAALGRAQEGRAWWDWPEDLVRRDPAALERARRDLRPDVDAEIALQLLFEDQWRSLRVDANGRGLRLLGDIPIYVDRNSADVWAARDQFRVGSDGRPSGVAGVPPDYFAEEGQLWGNPLYDWGRMAEDGYAWWIARLRRTLDLVDVVRIDHFRAFASYWEVPADATDARGGAWREGPGRGFFDAVRKALGGLPIVAEDLGILGDDVHALRDDVGLPGMAVLQFAFGGGADNHYLPHHHRDHQVIYTGTHDNDTTAGWWQKASPGVREHASRYLRLDPRAAAGDAARTLVQTALASVAHTAIVPFQDLLALGSDARMNTPGLADGNWLWRVRAEAMNPTVAGRFREDVALFDRLPGREEAAS